MDIRKAFDGTWIDGLFWKLYQTGINGLAWRILYQSYCKYKCRVLVNGVMNSESFYVRRGVHQGGVCSMHLYQFFIADLLNDLLDSNCIAKIGGHPVGCPAYADDLALITTVPEYINTLLKVAHEYSRRWRFEFHPDKCVIMTYGPAKRTLYDFKLGTASLKTVQTAQHVGIPLGKTKDHVKSAISAARRKYCSLLGLGNGCGGIHPLLASKLYWSFAYPTMTYGCAVIPYSEDDIKLMECAHREIGKRIQSLPKNTPDPVATRLLGWMPVQAKIDCDRLMFLFMLLSLPMNCIYKIICLESLIRMMYTNVTCKHMKSPIYYMWETVLKYNLTDCE